MKTNQDPFFLDIFRQLTANTYIELLHDCSLTFPLPPGPLRFPATARSPRGMFKEGILLVYLTLTMGKIYLKVFVLFLFIRANRENYELFNKH